MIDEKEYIADMYRQYLDAADTFSPSMIEKIKGEIAKADKERQEYLDNLKTN